MTIEVAPPEIQFPFQVGQVDLIEDSRLTAPLADGGFVTIGNQIGTEFLPGNLMGQRYDAQGQPVGNSFLIHAWQKRSAFQELKEKFLLVVLLMVDLWLFSTIDLL